MIMSYATPALIFLMVLSPLYIPIGVTVVHAIRGWRSRVTALDTAPARAPRRRRLELAAEFD